MGTAGEGIKRPCQLLINGGEKASIRQRGPMQDLATITKKAKTQRAVGRAFNSGKVTKKARIKLPHIPQGRGEIIRWLTAILRSGTIDMNLSCISFGAGKGEKRKAIVRIKPIKTTYKVVSKI